MELFASDWTDRGSRLVFIVGLFMPVILIMLAILCGDRYRAGRVRRFRCRDAGKEVEVWFVGDEVRACSAFEPPDAITCRRACRDSAYRGQWEPAPPVLARRPPASGVAA